MDASLKNNLRNTGENSLEMRALEIKKRAYSSFHQYMKILWENSAIDDKKGAFIKNVKDNITTIAIEAVGDLNEVDNALSASENEDLLLDKATNVTIKIIARYLSLDELEHRFNKNPLSRGLSFKIDKDSNKVNLYIPITFFENLNQAVQSYITGLKILAHKMVTDEEFKDIREVVGFSPFVKKYHKRLEKYGFKITLDKDGQPTEEAKMSKEKLLEIYGK